MSNNSLEEVFLVFNEIQTGTNTKENLDKLLNFVEKKSIKQLISNLENVFLIIVKNYDKNNIPLNNIKDFLKQFIKKLTKQQKKMQLTKELICYFCNFFTQNTKKMKYLSINIYFLELFLWPYSNDFEGIYDDKTCQTIKDYILNILKSKQTNIQMSVLKILQKNIALQKDEDILKCLEGLIDNSPVAIKKEIIKLLDFENNSEKLKFLLDMYDDDNWEIRSLVIEKLSNLTNFNLIDSNNKVRLLFIGLSDKNEKVKQNAKRFFKNYLNFLGIITDKNDSDKNKDNMAIDENMQEVSFINNNAKLSDENNKIDLQTVDEKIDNATSPLRLKKKESIKLSPALLFENLNFINYYFNPKFSYVFQLVTDSLIECSTYESLVELYEGIINHLMSSSNTSSLVKFQPRKRTMERFDNSNYSLLYEMIFLQNSIKILNNTKNDHYNTINTKLSDILPDTRTLAKIIEYFFVESCNPLILHQLLLISNYFTYIDEIGNRDMQNVILQLLNDVHLDRKSLRPRFSSNKINRNDFSEFKDIKVEEDEDVEELDISHYMITQVENLLLPPNRRLVETLEDLIDFSLKILLNIFENNHNQLFTCIMKLITELKEKLDGGEEEAIDSIKSKKIEILDQIKNKLIEVENLKNLRNEDKKKRLEFEKKIKAEENAIDDLDRELLEIIREEKQIYIRVLKLCEFLIKYCKISTNEIHTIINTILIPCIKKKDFPEVMRQSYLVMGVCSINYSKEFNYLSFFFSNIDKNITENILEFKDFDMTSLFVIFDTILHNDISQLNIGDSIDGKMYPIVKKFLYHNDYLPRIIIFIGLSKLLIGDKIENPQYYLSRMIVQLLNSYEVIDKHSEEYHTKLYEIFQNFIFYYSRNLSNIKVIMQAIVIILTTKFLEPIINGTGASNNQLVDTVLYNYLNTRIEHLVSFVNILNNFNNSSTSSHKFFIFKIFKYITFFLLYICLDDELMMDKNVIKNIHFNRNNIVALIKKFFEKSKLDKYLNEKMPENYRKKYLKFLIELNNKQLLSKISDAFTNFLDEKRNEENSKLDEECDSLNSYLEMNISKYFKRVESYYEFLIGLKDERINIIYEEGTYISDVEMERSSMTKEKIIPNTTEKENNSPYSNKSKRKTKVKKSPEKDKRKKEFKF